MRQPRRIQRRRTKGWRMPMGAVCVTRPGIFGNPFTAWLGRAECLRLYHLFLNAEWSRLEREGSWRLGITLDELKARRIELVKRLPELRGHDLACWCPLGVECHADVLLAWANGERP